ncbi:MAG: tetratricopeptide repeat protein [Deltaproteobacteria bacterium]|nr:tetratricopeptide repeat protein [Candidatus Tharpella sp.]
MPLPYLLLVALLSLPVFFLLFWRRKKIFAFCRRFFGQPEGGDTSQIIEEDKLPAEESTILRTYFKGLSYVLANETDKAVAEFVKVARINTTTAEIYLALGQLFRNSGEMERAIRVHRDILLRPNLPDEVRRQTFFEIGLDYKRAGLLDRACRTFEELLVRDPENTAARKELSSLYVNLREWGKALTLHKSSPSTKNELNLIAHLTTEVAKAAEATGNKEKALKFFLQALELDDGCIDAWLHYGDFLKNENQILEALDAWERAFILNPDFVTLVISRFSGLPEEQKNKIEKEFFSRHLKEYSENRKFNLAYIGWLIKSGGLEEAGSCLEQVMKEKSGDAEVFSLASKLIDKISTSIGIGGELYNSVVRNFFSTQLRFEKSYRCRKCGYLLDEMAWKCPRCSTWDSVTVR